MTLFAAMWQALQLLAIFHALFYRDSGNASVEALVGVGVRKVEENEHPFVVYIRLKEEYKSVSSKECSGTLISKRHILTVEHCFDDGTLPEHLEVLIGSSRLDRCLAYGVKSRFIFRDWCQKNNEVCDSVIDDLTVLTLMKRVRGFKPVTFSNKKNNEARGMSVQTAGWGKSSGRNDVMQTASLTILSRSECKEILRQHNLDENSLPESFLCTRADPFVVLTRGDSGGPLFYKGNKVLAINRSICPYYVPECSRVNIHIGIDRYRKFIQKVLKSD